MVLQNNVDTLNKPHHVDILSSPDVVAGLLVSVFLFVFGAIRLTRTTVGQRGIESYSTYVGASRSKPVQTQRGGYLRKYLGICSSWKTFWGKFPRRMWNFYIEAFLIPAYRNEWGKYKIWSYKARTRPPKPPLLRIQTRIQKSILRQAALLSSQQHRNRIHTPVPHSHEGCERIRINVGGMKYETQLRTLQRFPNTLLGNKEKRIKYYNPNTQEYYFDRHRQAFESILYFYQSGGRLRRPENIQADVLVQDAEFFELGEQTIEQFRLEENIAQPTNRCEILPSILLMRKIWLLFDYPDSSENASLVAYLSMSALFLSIFQFCSETLESLELKPIYGVDETNGHVIIKHYDPLDITDPWFFTETICNAWFIFEFVMRLLSSPVKSLFFKSILNIIDLAAFLPYMITVCGPSWFNDNSSGSGSATASTYSQLLKILRLTRVFRIFNLSKHSKGLKILWKTLRASLNELILLIFFVFLGVVLFSSTIYFAEISEKNTHFDSIPGGFWWALITITTIGYGDDVPKTPAGKIVGALCAVAGVLTIALPVPVIVSNFNFFYHQAIDDDLRWININHVTPCPYRPGGFGKKPNKIETAERQTKCYSSDEEFYSLKK